MEAMRISFTDHDHTLAPAVVRLAESKGLSVSSVERFREYQDHQIEVLIESGDSTAPESHIQFLKELPDVGVRHCWVEVFTPNETLLRPKQEFEAAGNSGTSFETRY